MSGKPLKFYKTLILVVWFFPGFFYVGSAQSPVINILSNTTPAEGYIFLASLHFNNAHPNDLLILDKNGTIVVDKVFPGTFDSNYADFKPQTRNRFSFFNPKTKCFYLLDRFLNISDSIVAGNGFSTDSHELLITNDEHYFLIASETRTINMSLLVAGGKVNASVKGTVVQELDSARNVLFEWKSLDYLPVTDCKGQNLTALSIDYIHTNSLFLDSDSTLIMSNRHLNELTKINRKTGVIIWRMGKNANANQFTFVNDSLGFSYQHHARLLPNGNLTLFDNGNFRANGIKYSRACEYKMDEATKTATLVWYYRNTPDNISRAMGSVQRLANGNTLIDWGVSYPNVTEVDANNTKVFEMSFQPSTTMYSYRAVKVEMQLDVFTGISQNGMSGDRSLAIYPNPNRGEFTLRIGSSEPAQVAIYNMLGELVSSKEMRTEESFYDLPKGIYTVVVTGAEFHFQKKMVVY
ncbi:MAG: aryl-sulfate sulfotransferase [bacterium]|nr:aryl-sulfate sulfotransferase [bacterium]